jgi:hypothetical protein
MLLQIEIYIKLYMKKQIISSLVILAVIFCVSCRNNRLKTNEKELSKEILSQEKQKLISEKEDHEHQFSDTLNRLSKSFRFSEVRSIDPKHLPMIIDIVGNLKNLNDIKLSDIASKVSYIRMQPVPDSTIPRDLKFKYQLLDNYIVAINLYGIHLYSKDGRYLRSIVKNEMTGVEVSENSIRFWNDYTKRGGSMSVQTNGDKLFYNYGNNITGQNYIMQFDGSSNQMTPDYKFDPENPHQIAGLGTIAMDLNNGKTEPPKPRKHQGMFGGTPEAFFYDRGIFMIDGSSYVLPEHKKNMMVVLNKKGDTLSTFTQLEQLKNYTKSLQRNTDPGSQYEENGTLYFRPAFNDTVFKLIPPNMLYPVYVLILGDYKVTMQQGVDPDFILTGKIIPGEWAETKDYIFMTFTKDSYDCPINRKNKTVKIYHALFSKLTHNVSIFKGDPYDYSPEIIENNIDGGMPVWPSSYMISKNGEILISLKGRDLKDRIKSKEFKLSGAPASKKRELEILATSVSGTEDILMIIQ